MNVLQIAAYCADFPGNFIFSLLCIDEEIKKQGGNVIYAFPNEARDKSWCIELQKQRRVYFLPLAKARLNLKTYFEIRRICRHEEIEIIHSHFELYDIPSIFTPIKVKIVWHMHDAIGAESGMKAMIRKWQYHYLSKRVNVIAISSDDKKTLIGLHCPENRIKIIANGINTDALAHVNIPKDYPIFLSMGWDYKRKGIDLILEAAKKLRNEYQNFKLIINCRKETISKIQQQVDKDWVIIQLPQKNMKDIYEKANIFIQASRYETFSFSVCEAAYAGLQLINSDISGLAWAKELECVHVFESENVNDLYFRMKELVEHFSKIKWNSMKDRNTIEEKYSAKRWANDIYNVYEELLENEKRTES